MRFALLLLLVAISAGCPRQSNETVPMARGSEAQQNAPFAPTSVRQVTPTVVTPEAAQGQIPGAVEAVKGARLHAPEIKPPIPYLELGSGFKPAELPSDVADEFPSGRLSRDKSELGVTENGEVIWLQGFTTKAGDDAIGNYYNGLLGVKGFQKIDPQEIRKSKKFKSKKKAMRSWRSPDHNFVVYLYQSGQTAAPAEKTESLPIYVVEVHEVPTSSHGGTGP